MGEQREKFATQMDAALLADLRELARTEGRQIQVLLEEAVRGLLDDRDGASRREKVKALHERAIDRYEDVFRKLAE
ncbi:hypothetical protein [Hyphobacterium sp.]|uniref:hypothetical protein n=1 Tax=Hyphobacterium sp. TaxID=2004662 RepID=UPI003BAAB082